MPWPSPLNTETLARALSARRLAPDRHRCCRRRPHACRVGRQVVDALPRLGDQVAAAARMYRRCSVQHSDGAGQASPPRWRPIRSQWPRRRHRRWPCRPGLPSEPAPGGAKAVVRAPSRIPPHCVGLGNDQVIDGVVVEFRPGSRRKLSGMLVAGLIVPSARQYPTRTVGLKTGIAGLLATDAPASR